MSNKTKKLESVKEYYGKVLSGTHDLKTNACCSAEYLPTNHKEILSQIDEEILTKFYGCGSPIPPELDGRVVLDLGCGSGRDVYLSSRLVGPKGFVIGVDMTEEQLLVARRHIDSQTKKFGFSKPNVEFKKGYIEDLEGAGIKDNSVDVVISNCVINLSPDKRQVFSEIFRVLKPGGELYFSDVFADRRVPEHLQSDPELYGECLSGALYIEDFRRILAELGCPDHRVVFKKLITINNPKMKAKAGMINFYSMTIRAFELDSLEDKCEDYGQVATYLGTIDEAPHNFVLDDHHEFITGKPMPICGNTASMLTETRYSKHFKVSEDIKKHYGLFPCGKSIEGINVSESSNNGSCC
jgi:SAM-dependent methyltransferase